MMWLSGWLSLKELCQSEWRRETTVGRWSGWVVGLSRVISEWVRERDQNLEMKWLSGWAFKSDIRVRPGERPQLGHEVVEWLSFQEWYQREWGTDISELGDEMVEWLSFQEWYQRESEAQTHQSLEMKWLSGWAFKSDLRVSVGERPQSGDQAVEWLSFWEWYQRRRETTVWALPISSRKLWLGGWPFKSDLGDTERGEQHKNSEEFMWLSG